MVNKYTTRGMHDIHKVAFLEQGGPICTSGGGVSSTRHSGPLSVMPSKTEILVVENNTIQPL